MLKNIYRELVLIRKELQAIRKCLKPQEADRDIKICADRCLVDTMRKAKLRERRKQP